MRRISELCSWQPIWQDWKCGLEMRTDRRILTWPPEFPTQPRSGGSAKIRLTDLPGVRLVTVLGFEQGVRLNNYGQTMSDEAPRPSPPPFCFADYAKRGEGETLPASRRIMSLQTKDNVLMRPAARNIQLAA